MRTVEIVLIESIVIGPHPLPCNPSVLKLVDFIRSGGQVPPIKLQKCGTGYRLKDGRHRVAAFKLLGAKEIMAAFATEQITYVNLALLTE